MHDVAIPLTLGWQRLAVQREAALDIRIGAAVVHPRTLDLGVVRARPAHAIGLAAEVELDWRYVAPRAGVWVCMMSIVSSPTLADALSPGLRMTANAGPRVGAVRKVIGRAVDPRCLGADATPDQCAAARNAVQGDAASRATRIEHGRHHDVSLTTIGVAHSTWNSIQILPCRQGVAAVEAPWLGPQAPTQALEPAMGPARHLAPRRLLAKRCLRRARSRQECSASWLRRAVTTLLMIPYPTFGFGAHLRQGGPHAGSSPNIALHLEYD